MPWPTHFGKVENLENLNWEFQPDAVGTMAVENLGYIILAGFIFGTIGLGANSYGKRLGLWQPRAIGWTLMIYPYVVFNLWLLWGIGVGLLVLLWFFHHE